MSDPTIAAPQVQGADAGWSAGHMPSDATLIYNRRAGGSERHSPDHLIEKLHQLGYRPVYRATDSEADLRRAVEAARGTVFVAGGDGTVRSAALLLARRGDLTLGIIPMGTANNIGRTLGVMGEPLDVLEGYRGAVARPFDLGRVQAPWGEDLFLEACGCGAFADIITEYDPEDGKSPLRAVQALTTALGHFDPPLIPVTLDGQRLPPAPYALLEVLNTRATGPRLHLAPQADPGDGFFDVICVDAEHRQTMLAYLTALARDEFGDLASVQARRARVVEIPYSGQAFHVDGEVRPPLQAGQGASVRIEVWPGALKVLTPAEERP